MQGKKHCPIHVGGLWVPKQNVWSFRSEWYVNNFAVHYNHYKLQIGKHPCLWCKIENSGLKTPLADRGRAPKRTLEDLKADHRQFIEKGGGDIKNAKFYFNVIGETIMDIPLTHVCVLYA